MVEAGVGHTRDLPGRIGRYPITGVLGQGAMGIVYRATDPIIRRAVAIKAIRKDLLFDSEVAESVGARFRNEVQAAGSLLHPNIVSIYEYGEEGGLAYIVMECVEGHSLREYSERRFRFGVADAIAIAAQLLDALHFAHENGVWHRDVKPSNLKITEDGRLKVLDFGIARIESSTLTQVGAVLGTPGFMAPEQYLERYVDHRVDVFAAGVVVYRLLSGVTPFTGSREDVMRKTCYETPMPLSQACQQAELAPFDPVLAKALARNADDRFVSAAAFRTALLEAYGDPIRPAVSARAILQPQAAAFARLSTIQTIPLGKDLPTPARGEADTVPPASATSPSIELLASAGEFQTPRPVPATVASKAAPPPGVEAAALAQIERSLALFVGPIARIHLRLAVAQGGDASAIVGRLANLLSDYTERARFLAQNAAFAPRPAPDAVDDDATVIDGAAGTVDARERVTLQDQELAARLLVRYLGPIAPLIAERAARGNPPRAAFHLQLAERLSDPNERRRFLTELGMPLKREKH
jgi:eukaryotic-like serine/threonine-protein kinase